MYAIIPHSNGTKETTVTVLLQNAESTLKLRELDAITGRAPYFDNQ